VAVASPVKKFSEAVPVPEAIDDPPLAADEIATPEADTPPGPALPVPAPDAEPLPRLPVLILNNIGNLKS